MNRELLSQWRELLDCEIERINIGLINESYKVSSKHGHFVLQKLNKIFDPILHNDIFAVTSHLKHKGIITPELVRTSTGHLYAENSDQIFRLFTLIPGESLDFLKDIAAAQEVGLLVGRFHACLIDFDYKYMHARAGFHDTPRYILHLQTALDTHRSHRNYEAVAEVSRELLSEARELISFDTLPRRHCHGDLKINNVLFRGNQAICVVDLDTLGRMPLPIEMGDALRSWCNTKGEDTEDTQFDCEIFGAALNGYSEYATSFLTTDEINALVPGIETVCLELAARFLTDALEERYFGFDSSRFPSRGTHNLVRGLGQWNLFKHVKDKRGDLQEIALSLLAR